MTEEQQIRKDLEKVDGIIRLKEAFLAFVKKDEGKEIIQAFELEQVKALEDYLRDNTIINQAYARTWNFIVNFIFELKENSKSELGNAIKDKDSLMFDLKRATKMAQDPGSQQPGGSV